jgi:hypothetical protein
VSEKSIARQQAGSSDGQKRAVGTPPVSPVPALVPNSLCRGHERCTMRQKVSQIGNPVLDDPVWDATVFTKNRDRLLEVEVAKEFLARVVAQAREQGWTSGGESSRIDCVEPRVGGHGHRRALRRAGDVAGGSGNRARDGGRRQGFRYGGFCARVPEPAHDPACGAKPDTNRRQRHRWAHHATRGLSHQPEEEETHRRMFWLAEDDCVVAPSASSRNVASGVDVYLRLCGLQSGAHAKSDGRHSSGAVSSGRSVGERR